MNNIGIITFHRAHNYGAVLQAYALSKTLNAHKSVSAKFVDYSPSRITDGYLPFPKLSGRSFLDPRVVLPRLIKYPPKLQRYKKFNSFINDFLPLGEADPEKYDMVVCGSDQVWNPTITYGADPFYYGGKGNVKRISYAASIGITTIPEQFRAEMTSLMQKFSNISVRENSGLEILKNELGIKDAQEVVDPCLLLSPQEWRAIAITSEIEDDYIFVYRMDNSQRLIEDATKLAKEKNCKIIEVAYGYSPRNRLSPNHDVRLNIGPREFLGLIDNAKYVFTNSFHATVFSLILEKEFRAYSIGNLSSRIENVLALAGMTVCYVTNDDSNAVVGSKVAKSQSRIAVTIENSRKYLSDALSTL